VGIKVYTAERAPWPGTYLYDQKFIPAIASSDCVLVLLTSSAAISQDVNQEIAFGHIQKKPIVALVENGVQIKGLLVGREVVYFDRNIPLPALQVAYDYIQNQASMKEKAESELNAALLIGGIALFLLAFGENK
jgi:hypothetical protein